ncbi:MAG: trypsin-like peptidase domain-containing protein [Coriobacteriales bacterium]|jgi:putative serine protease PepD|nr:trypsin-like peptidase domain-containing protein [Coriobacteriales bacterium]
MTDFNQQDTEPRETSSPVLPEGTQPAVPEEAVKPEAPKQVLLPASVAQPETAEPVAAPASEVQSEVLEQVVASAPAAQPETAEPVLAPTPPTPSQAEPQAPLSNQTWAQPQQPYQPQQYQPYQAPQQHQPYQPQQPYQQPYQPQQPQYQTPPLAVRPPTVQHKAGTQPQHTATSAQPHKTRDSSKGLALVMGLVGVLVGAAVSFGVLSLVANNLLPGSSDAIQIGDGDQIVINPSGEDVSLAEAVSAKALPSVVNIDVYAPSSSGFYDDFGSDGGGTLEEYGLGSGVVISEDGYILTNYHVVEGGTEFMVRFDQNTQLKATLKGQDVTSDLAVLKVEATGLKPIEVADSSEVNVGEWVMALGSPFGLEKSVSTGIVSALFRSTTMESQAGTNVYANMIQTDAAINPGNSGGALVNAEGKLIGINTLISSSSGTSAGVGFAIPSNYAMNIAQQIMAGKEVVHAFLGVQLRTVEPGSTSSLDSGVQAGAYISKVVGGSPAESAGLKEGDVITKLDGSPIASGAELVISVRGHLVGDKISLEVQRSGETKTIEVTLGSDETS